MTENHKQPNEGEIDLRNIIIGLVSATVALTILKLFGVISWSWWAVMSPLWVVIAAVLILIVFVLLYVTTTGGHIEVARSNRKKDKPSV